MKSKRVLIVDDNDLNRHLFENLIGYLFSYESAKNGLEAVQMATTRDFDLILMDIQMPQMDGITAMKKIKNERLTSCPILAVTAYAKESDRSFFISEGFDDFMIKPVRPERFMKIIQSYLIKNQKTTLQDESNDSESPILDRKILTQLVKYNSKPAIQDIFNEFLLECSETEQLIEASDPNSYPTELLSRIHTLKGNSGTLGAMGIFYSAKIAEELGRNEDIQEFYQEIKKTANEIRKFRDFFNQESIFDL